MSVARRVADEWASFVLALQFLTRIAISSDGLFSEAREAAAVRYYPLVGALIGATGAGVWWMATLLLHDALTAVLLASAATMLLTGAFHEDGLADTLDGIGGGLTRERALEIMRDSRLGTYGTLALGTVVAIKVATLTALSVRAPASVIVMLFVGAHALSRVCAVVVVATSDYVREAGTAKPVARAVDSTTMLVVCVLSFATLAAVQLVSMTALTASAASWLTICATAGLGLGHLAARQLFERKLGGYTGDCLGAVQQLSELGFLLGALAAL